MSATAPAAVAARSTRWWTVASLLAREAGAGAARPVARASFRLGDAILDIDSTYEPLMQELRDAYANCELPAGGRATGPRLACSARSIEQTSLVALQFGLPQGAPHLAEVAFRLIRPRAELGHFSVRDLDVRGWRLIANALDESAPLLAADTHAAVIDTNQQPPELLLNFVVGAVQTAQQPVMFIHAGGVSIDGRGTLLFGRSGRGKSTTTAALASRGHGLLGDETIGLRPDSLEILPFRRTLKMRPGPRGQAVAERLRTVPHRMAPDAQGTMCAWVGPDDLFPGGAAAAVTPLREIFILRSFGAQASIEPFAISMAHLDELQALSMSLSAVVSWPSSPAQRLVRFARLAELFGRCQSYFVDLGTPDETAALIESTVRNHAPDRP